MNGIDLIEKHEQILLELIAATSLWCRREVVDELRKEDGNENARWYLNIRRFRKNKEVLRSYVDGDFLDGNSKANAAIKAALGYNGKVEKFHTCHIYDDESETYDRNFYCAIPNLVLIPSSIHSLADHLPECKKTLRYRAYELYGFYKGSKPIKPKNYDSLKELWHPYVGSLDRALQSVKRRRSTLKPKVKS
ncbi:MAG: hypothetical protein JWP58_2322 [Hymenobacter sp.]|nr:hypothetical protein [Hymenobacter sp.]